MGKRLRLNAKLLLSAIALFTSIALLSSITIYLTIQEHAERDFEEIRTQHLSDAQGVLKSRVDSFYGMVSHLYREEFELSKLRRQYGARLSTAMVLMSLSPGLVKSEHWDQRAKQVYWRSGLPIVPDLVWRCPENPEKGLPELAVVSRRPSMGLMTPSWAMSAIRSPDDLCQSETHSFGLSWIGVPDGSIFQTRVPFLFHEDVIDGVHVGIAIVLEDLKERVAQELIPALRSMALGLGEGYVWLNDVSDPYPRMIMHPTIPGIEGTVLKGSAYETAPGKGDHFLKDAYPKLEADGEGVLHYFWPKPETVGQERTYRKMSYVKFFRPFGWVIGSGAYLETIDLAINEKSKSIAQDTRKLLKRTILVVGLIFILSVLVVLRIAEDIEARREAERIMRVGEERLGLALRGAELGLWDFSFANHELYCDARWCQIVGLSDRDLWISVNRFLEGVHPDDAVQVKELFEVNEHGALKRSEHTYRVRTSAGQWRWVLSRGQVVESDSSGKALRASGTHLDITAQRESQKEREKLEAGLREVRRLESIGRLAGGVAHDLNNMLSPIIGYTDMLLLDTTQGGRGHRELKAISEAAYRAKNLTWQLLAVGRRQVLRVRTLDLNELIRSFEKLLKPMIREDIEVTIDLDAEAAKVKGDGSQLEQILLNLVVNAQDAMPRGGKLFISTERSKLDALTASKIPELSPGDYVVMSVRDTGFGIDEETKRRIFEPFFTTKEIGAGTGLGLATVQGIVEQHGGCVRVLSSLGHGATFQIYLPYVDASLDKRVETRHESIDYSGGETILVVEDERLVRELACEVLSQHGYKVIEAEGPKVALDLYSNGFSEREKPDLLLTDVVMPEMDGRQLHKKLIEKMPGLKVLYMSGYNDDVIHVRGVSEDGLEFIQKPFTVGALTRKVREILEQATKA
jgi:signal transduction histidine kinase/CheY-like chemotaxis protein